MSSWACSSFTTGARNSSSMKIVFRLFASSRVHTEHAFPLVVFSSGLRRMPRWHSILHFMPVHCLSLGLLVVFSLWCIWVLLGVKESFEAFVAFLCVVCIGARVDS